MQVSELLTDIGKTDLTDYYFDIETVPKDPNDLNKKTNLDPIKTNLIKYANLD